MRHFAQTKTLYAALLRAATLAAVLAVGSAQANGFGRYSSDEPLSAERAFPVSVMTGRDGNILVTWEMPPGYYIYQDKLEFAARGGFTIKHVTVPAGLVEADPFLGTVRIFRDHVTVVISPDVVGRSGELLVKFQGCAEDLLCYPAVQRTFRVNAAAAG